MLFRLTILLGVLIVPIGFATAQTVVSDDIRSDATWQASAGPYRITRDVDVADGATLTISPGTVVEFGFSGTLFVGNGARLIADSVEFRPIHTRGLEAAVLQHEGAGAGHVEIRRSRIENLYLYNSGGGDFSVEDTRFIGEGHLRLYGTAPVRVTGCTFESTQPIRTHIGLPKSAIVENVYAPNSVLYHRDAQRIVTDDTVRAYGNLPIQFGNNISVSKGARLTVLPGTEIRLGYFDSFLINGEAILEITGAVIRPAEPGGPFPAVIVSQGDGPGHAEISESVIESTYLRFSGGTGRVVHTDFLSAAGAPALVNVGSTPIVATNNYWNGSDGPFHAANPSGNGAAVDGPVEFTPWAGQPFSSAPTSTESAAPRSFSLKKPFPNPASSVTTFAYTAPPFSDVRWSLHDVLGRRVRNPVDGLQSGTSGSLSIDVTTLPVGSYFLRLEVDGRIETCKIIVIR